MDLSALGGTGLGAVATIRTIQPFPPAGNPNADANANGCVSWNGSTRVIGGSLGANGCNTADDNDVKTGASQTQA